MLQRTLTTLFLLTLLVTQTLSGACRLRCDHTAATSKAPSCHSMSMAESIPQAQAAAPCNTHFCPTDASLLASTSTDTQTDLGPSSSAQGTLPNALQALALTSDVTFADPPDATPPITAASLLRTTLRL